MNTEILEACKLMLFGLKIIGGLFGILWAVLFLVENIYVDKYRNYLKRCPNDHYKVKSKLRRKISDIDKLIKVAGWGMINNVLLILIAFAIEYRYF